VDRAVVQRNWKGRSTSEGASRSLLVQIADEHVDYSALASDSHLQGRASKCETVFELCPFITVASMIADRACARAACRAKTRANSRLSQHVQQRPADALGLVRANDQRMQASAKLGAFR